MRKNLIICIICCVILTGCSGMEKLDWGALGAAGEAASQSEESEKAEDVVSDEFVMDKKQPEGFMSEMGRKTEVPKGFVGIYSVDDLKQLKDDDGQYILMSDLDMSDVKWTAGKFKGTFDGNCHVISHLKSCLFDLIRGQVKSLGLEDVDVSGAALTSWMVEGEIDNCYVTGRVHGHSGIADLVGLRDGSSITIANCYNAAEIINEGSDSAVTYIYGTGGIVGDITLRGKGSSALFINNCENYGKIVGYSKTGGIIGWLNREAREGYDGEADINITVANCCNYGVVSGKDSVGGIVGDVNINNINMSLKNTYTIRNCANYNEVSVSERVNCTAGAICGKLYLCDFREDNSALEIKIQDCLNTAAVSIMHENGTRDGGGVCGDIELDYGTCIINCCLNIGNTCSEYKNKYDIGYSTPVYKCKDYYTQADMSIRDMKNMTENLPSFSYPDVWGIDSLYSGFPHPYGSGENKEVWAYYEQKKKELTDAMQRNMDESELILMQRYADMLATMGLGGYWPEDREHNYMSLDNLLEYNYDDLKNYYAVADIDEDQQKELLVEVSGGPIRIYRYDLENGGISVEETQQLRKEFEKSHGGKGTLQWQVSEYTNYQVYSEAYTQYYMERLKKDMSSDVGAEYVETKMNDMEFIKKISDDYGLEFKEDGFEYVAYDGREAVFSIYTEDGGYLKYQGKQIDGVTVFGVYPGMEEKEAGEVLSKYGFLQYGENSYYTGAAPGNYFVYLTVENGVVKAVSTYQGSMYIG